MNLDNNPYVISRFFAFTPGRKPSQNFLGNASPQIPRFRVPTTPHSSGLSLCLNCILRKAALLWDRPYQRYNHRHGSLQRDYNYNSEEGDDNGSTFGLKLKFRVLNSYGYLLITDVCTRYNLCWKYIYRLLIHVYLLADKTNVPWIIVYLIVDSVVYRTSQYPRFSCLENTRRCHKRGSKWWLHAASIRFWLWYYIATIPFQIQHSE